MKTFETNIYVMNVYDDAYVELIVKRDVLFDVHDLVESKQFLKEYMPAKKFYVLMTGEDFFQVTKESREVAASKEFSDHLVAVALHSRNLSLKLLGDLYIKLNKPAVPTRFFNTRKIAEDWLKRSIRRDNSLQSGSGT